MAKRQELVANLYNPHHQNKQQLIDRFVVRQKRFKSLFKDIREASMEVPEQHMVIVGQRGMGKTSLLLRLSYAIEDEPSLKDWLVPIVFNEEQYSIGGLFGLWEETAKHLEDKLAAFEGLFDKMDALYQDDLDRYGDTCFALLTEALHAEGKKLVLFIDNLGELFQKFSKKESQRLREILTTSADIRIIGASSTMIESFFQYDKPFYEFFKEIRLEGLNKEEAQKLLLELGEYYQKAVIKEIIEHDPGRVEALRRLTGGVIRTMILLFEIFVDDKDGEAFGDLEKILDVITPLYKHRMDDLSRQQQQIVHAIAIHWDGISTKEIVRKTRLESKKISAQLSQLCDNDIIVKIPTGTKNHLYQLKERFFNVWYLMRNGRKYDKQRVVWLTRFFETWCKEEDFQRVVHQYISTLKIGKYASDDSAFLMSTALANSNLISQELQEKLLNTTKNYLQNNESDLAEKLSKSDKALYEEAVGILEEDSSKALSLLEQINDKDEKTYVLMGLIWECVKEDEEMAEEYYKLAEKQGDELINQIKHLAEEKKEGFNPLNLIFQEDLKYKNSSILCRLGLICEQLFLEGKSMLFFLEVASLELFDSEIREALEISSFKILQKLILDKRYAFLVNEVTQHIELDKFLKAILTIPHSPEFVDKLSPDQLENFEAGINMFLATNYAVKKDYDSAKQHFELASQKGIRDADIDLAQIYVINNKLDKAKELLRKVSEADFPNASYKLALLLEKSPDENERIEAKRYFEKALKGGIIEAGVRLGNIYLANNELGQAKKYFVEYKDTNLIAKLGLAIVLMYKGENKEESLQLIEQFISGLNQLDLFPKLYKFYAHIFLWNEKYPKAFTIADKFIYNGEKIKPFLLLLLAKRQFSYLHNFFTGPKGQAHHTKDRYKPIWYALMHYMREEHPMEYLKMGPELKETVEEVIAQVEEMAVKYA